ncbi:MAG: hypothetical protein ACYTEQ_16680 [Planctomycetota bacterium]
MPASRMCPAAARSEHLNTGIVAVVDITHEPNADGTDTGIAWARDADFLASLGEIKLAASDHDLVFLQGGISLEVDGERDGRNEEVSQY